jgi:hypothetical protein
MSVSPLDTVVCVAHLGMMTQGVGNSAPSEPETKRLRADESSSPAVSSACPVLVSSTAFGSQAVGASVWLGDVPVRFAGSKTTWWECTIKPIYERSLAVPAAAPYFELCPSLGHMCETSESDVSLQNYAV